MQLACVHTRGVLGLLAPAVTVEVHLGGGLPGLAIVGLAETAVKESRERVRAALVHCGFEFPNRKITVNLAPADLRKSGGRFDLAIAVGVLAASGQIPATRLATHEFFGELAFSGALRAVPGLLPALIAIPAERRAIVPAANAEEAALLGGSGVMLADHLVALVRHLQGLQSLPAVAKGPAVPPARPPPDDFRDVHGQLQAKRAVEIAAAGGHNLLLIGPPGAGKSMLARRLPGLLPPLADAEALEVAALFSLTGGAARRDWRQRPFRAPHHTASITALVGGGPDPRPGEISLAHHGVLFMDEIPEFSRPAIESLREPLDTGRVSVARTGRTIEYPAAFQLVAACNPCICGMAGDPSGSCRCSPDQIRRYQQRLSGPFLDRIDIRVHVARADVVLGPAPGGSEDSAAVAARVAGARRVQAERAGVLNARLDNEAARRHCTPDAAGRRLLEQAAHSLRLSQRGCDSVLRVARTITDLAGEPTVGRAQLAEALALRATGTLTH
jgi:magnesium chelatase family protein